MIFIFAPGCWKSLKSSTSIFLLEERKWSKPRKCFVKTKEEFEDIHMKKRDQQASNFPFYPATYNISPGCHSLKVKFNGGEQIRDPTAVYSQFMDFTAKEGH